MVDDNTWFSNREKGMKRFHMVQHIHKTIVFLTILVMMILQNVRGHPQSNLSYCNTKNAFLAGSDRCHHNRVAAAAAITTQFSFIAPPQPTSPTRLQYTLATPTTKRHSPARLIRRSIGTTNSFFSQQRTKLKSTVPYYYQFQQYKLFFTKKKYNDR
mmetsp:Transcript_2676/g.4151  ORF Transcript_2676/g.4151 Transcript_2676/m.4151 type:complete len:157 (-) Transcript_2676:3511-3981(-)